MSSGGTMMVKGIIFDINGTLSDIRTNEWHDDVYRHVYGAQGLGMKTVFFKSNQGTQEKEGVRPDYIIYNFPELLNAIQFFEDR
jgi:FMN phosphatase YigB (HAD superfamily)